MENTMFLSKDELYILTGYKHRSKQCDHLRRQGVAFRTNAHGDPIVCRSVLEGNLEKKQKAANEPWKPRLSA